MVRRKILVAMGFGVFAGTFYILNHATNFVESSANKKLHSMLPPSTLSPLIPNRDINQRSQTEQDANVNLIDKKNLPTEDQQILHAINLRFNTGDYPGALEHLEKALARHDISPDLKAWLEEQHPSILTTVGWLKVQTNNCEDAIDFFLQANHLKKIAVADKGLGLCYYKLGLHFLASSALESYIEQEPKDLDAYLLYADILESEGRFQDAVTALESIENLGEKDPRLEIALKAMRAKAHESVRQATWDSGHFKLTFNDESHRETVSIIAEELESALSDFQQIFYFPDPKQQIEVILYNPSSFKQVASGTPDWAGAFFDGRLRVPLASTGGELGNLPISLKRILRHELAHALIAQISDQRAVPTWLNEAIAQRLECNARCGGTLFPATPGSFLTQEEFEKPFITQNALNAEKRYRQSFYLLLNSFEQAQLSDEDAINRILTQIRKPGTISSQKIMESLGLNFRELMMLSGKRWDKRIQLK